MSDLLNNAFKTTGTLAASLKPILPSSNDTIRIWDIRNIYKGPTFIQENGYYAYVPKEGDWVIDRDNGWFYVAHVGLEGENLSTLVPWEAPSRGGTADDDLILLGDISRYTSEFILCAIDYSQMPPVMTVDNRIQVYGSNAVSAKIFLHNDIGVNGQVVSCQYDNSGNIVSDTVPLELVKFNESRNIAVRVPLPCHCSQNLADGETLTFVAYDKNGGPILPAYRLVVQNTAFVRRTELGQKYVKGVQLLSPFLNSNDPELLEIPVSIRSLASVEFRARVWYSDNSYKDWAVDGDRMVLNGVREYIPTIVGQQASLTLTYFLNDNEQAVTSNPGEKPHVDQNYRIRTTEAIGAYAPKLYGYPVWDAAKATWKMAMWLYNLDRQMAYEVTGKVELGVNSEPFDPKNYGVVQHLTYAITLASVDSRWKAYRHVQNLDVVIYGAPGSATGTDWTVGFDPGQEPVYGPNLSCKITGTSANARTVKIDSGIKTYNEWLEQMFYNTRPLRAIASESKAPAPTHFEVYVDAGHVYRYPVSQWNAALTIGTVLTAGQNVFIKWLKTDAGNVELQLGISALVVKL
ncbi:putative virion structural protein [Salmonella phage vB_SalM_SA002]|nr:putative virion structural protein [Salmonella phage vB_SalM_SA002]